MSHEPVQREAIDAEWQPFKETLKTAFTEIKEKKNALRYQQNISKAQLISNAMNQVWREIVL
jgi:hypothetical protein